MCMALAPIRSCCCPPKSHPEVDDRMFSVIIVPTVQVTPTENKNVFAVTAALSPHDSVSPCGMCSYNTHYFRLIFVLFSFTIRLAVTAVPPTTCVRIIRRTALTAQLCLCVQQCYHTIPPPLPLVVYNILSYICNLPLRLRDKLNWYAVNKFKQNVISDMASP